MWTFTFHSCLFLTWCLVTVAGVLNTPQVAMWVTDGAHKHIEGYIQAVITAVLLTLRQCYSPVWFLIQNTSLIVSLVYNTLVFFLIIFYIVFNLIIFPPTDNRLLLVKDAFFWHFFTCTFGLNAYSHLNTAGKKTKTIINTIALHVYLISKN